MTKFSKEDINNIIDLKGIDGKQIDIFELYGLIHVGNTENGEWDLTKTFCRFNSHSLFIDYEDFSWCETEDDVDEQFRDSLKEIVKERLL